MRTPVRIGAFAAVLAVVFAAAFGAGRLVGPDAIAEDRPAEHSPGEHGTGEHGTGEGSLAFAVDPYTSGAPSFRITGSDGRAVTAFDTVHDKPLHLIVVRRDLSGFQHVHPVMAADGTWRAPLTLDDGGPWRVYADFTPTGGTASVLAADLTVPGAQQARALPEPAASTVVDGYTVRLSTHDGVSLRVERDGRPVTDLQPYLGAAGHLVAIAQRDLAYLHVHPQDPATGGPDVRFAVEGATDGAQRLYFQFRHGDAVHTAEFTVTGIGGGHAHN